MNSEIQIRPVEISDVETITEIYKHHVLHGTGSFEIDPPSVEEMGRRIENVASRGLPYLVAVSGGAVVGYAYAG